MLGMAVAPTVSHALVALDPAGPWAELCTSGSGTRLMTWTETQAASTGDTAPVSPSLDSFAHCPLCCHVPDLAGLPPSDPAVLALPAGATLAPPLLLHAPRPLFAWSAAQPRAPPLLA